MILTGHILFTPCLAEILHASAILVTVSGTFFFSKLTDAEMIPNWNKKGKERLAGSSD